MLVPTPPRFQASQFRWPRGPAKITIRVMAITSLETYRAAVKCWPKDKITLRNRARVLEKLGGLAGQRR